MTLEVAMTCINLVDIYLHSMSFNVLSYEDDIEKNILYCLDLVHGFNKICEYN